MLKELFKISVQKFLRFLKLELPATSIHDSKVELAVKNLEKKAIEFKQPATFMVGAYAYFYVDVFRQSNLNQVYLRLQEFYSRIQHAPISKMSDEDVDLAYEVRESWNELNHIKLDKLPFRLRSNMRSVGLKVGKDVWFEHSNNFISFCEVAKFINEHSGWYPLMHGVTEFFLHLPIVKKMKVGKLQLSWYLTPQATMEKYFTTYYMQKPKHQRLQEFKRIMELNKSFDETSKEMWGYKFLQKEKQ